MILGDPRERSPAARTGARATLDDLLRRAAERRPEAIALCDPPDRERFTDGAPLALTYAQADRAVTAIAARLRRIGLHTDDVVGIQFGNTVESALTLLGILRAGLIAMPLPLLWRRAELISALGRVSASALVVGGRLGTTDHFELAMTVAAEIFPVRYVCGYGGNIPDGIVPFDDLLRNERLDPPPEVMVEREAEPGAHVAVITWDVTPDGLVPVARSHGELMAGGLAVMLEARMAQDTVILSPLPASSFAGIAVALVPWLMLGGTLALHQPFDGETFMRQWRERAADTVILPGTLVPLLAEAGHFAAGDRLANVVALWRSPERLPRTPAVTGRGLRLTDVQLFGETGLIAACRGEDGLPLAIPLGLVFAPRAPKGTIVAADVAATHAGTLALRGPMVPRAAFPPGAERGGLPYLKVSPSGYVDTGFACRADGATLTVTAPPPGLISVGGYRLAERALQALVNEADHGSATFAALPDALAGHRLAGGAGTADERAALRQALARLGASPLLVDAFADSPRSAV